MDARRQLARPDDPPPVGPPDPGHGREPPAAPGRIDVEEVVVAARFTDHTGPFMIHCRMLDHEDHGMMATFEVVP